MPRYNAFDAAYSPAKILFRAEEAADLMSISRTAVFGLIGSGDLHSIKIGGRRRIPRSSIDDYISRQLACDPAEGETSNDTRGSVRTARTQ